jgi:hypothetical protein
MRHPFTALTLILATVTAVTLVPEFARASRTKRRPRRRR